MNDKLQMVCMKKTLSEFRKVLVTLKNLLKDFPLQNCLIKISIDYLEAFF